MTKSLAVRLSTTAALCAAALAARANEGPEGLGDMEGPGALLFLVGGVAVLGVVIWLMVKFLGRAKK